MTKRDILKIAVIATVGVLTGLAAGYLFFRPKEEKAETPKQETYAEVPERIVRRPNPPLGDYFLSSDSENHSADVNGLDVMVPHEVSEAIKRKLSSETMPYIISRETFDDPEVGYQQAELQWYVGDKVLSDEHDDIIHEHDIPKTVGECLARFDEERDPDEDPDFIYIRNDLLEMDFEVERIEGTYAEIVLGLTPEEAEEHGRMIDEYGHD